MSKRKNKIFFIFSFLILVLTGVFLSINLINNSNNTKSNEMLEEIEENKGQYDEKSIVLNNTSKSKAEELANKYNAKLRMNSKGDFATLTLPNDVSVENFFKSEQNNEQINSFSLDYFARISEEYSTTPSYPIMSPEYEVNDSNYSYQTYLNYLNIKNVWNNYQGDGIKVAVIDTGIDTDHSEFLNKISNRSYNATTDKIVKDYDLSIIEDEQGHGTSVAGVIASSFDGKGIVGIAPNVELVIIKVDCDSKGQFYRTSDLVFGLYYAIECDVDVVNMSFGVASPINPFAEATKLAVDSDIICVAAAGNDSSAILTYPAADSNVIGVGALDNNSFELAQYSNYGENVNVVAPGTVYTTALNGEYRTIQGTSFASPIVASAIALLRQKEGKKGFTYIQELLYASSYDLGSLGEDFYFGYGALDISALIIEPRYTVTFNYLTDEIDETKQIFIKNHTLQNLSEPDRNYSVFDGWCYDIYCNEEVEYYSDRWQNDITLYAKWANEDDSVPYTYVTLDDGTIEIRSYTGHRRYITVPEYIEGKLVTSIGDEAFLNETKLRLIKLPQGIKKINRSSFENCINLTEMEIPDNVEFIGDSAFKNCHRLSNINFSKNSKVSSIGKYAFAFTGLKSFNVPKNVNNISGSTFLGTTKLVAYSVENGNSIYFAENGVLFNNIKNKIIAFPIAKSSTYELPTNITIIGESAFAYSRIKSICIANIVTIEENAFAYSYLDSINISDKTTSIGSKAFYNCFNLTEVSIGHGLTKIESSTFSYSPIEEITIPNSILLIGDWAFSSCGLTQITFEENSNIIEIGQYAFSSNNIKELSLPNSLLKIQAYAFSSNILLEKINFGTDLQKIGEYVFAYSLSLNIINLPSKITEIGSYAFKNSNIIGTVNIPVSVNKLGDGVFASCHNLTSFNVDSESVNYTAVDGVIYSRDLTTLIEYPAGNSNTTYQLLDSTAIIENAAFMGSNNLKSITLSEGLIEIHEYTFADMENLENIYISKGVKQIGRFAFNNDFNLRNVYFDADSELDRISAYSFANTGITSFVVPKNVSSIAQYSFEGSNRLTQITFTKDSKLEYISAYNFIGCDNLTSIIFEEGSNLTHLQAHSLEGLSNLTSIDLSNTKVNIINNYTFRYCDNLESITLPSTLERIGRFAFFANTKLSRILIPNSINYIGRYAFYGTNNIQVFFEAEENELSLQDNWDEGVGGYYFGVNEIISNDQYEAARLNSGNIAIVKYLGDSESVDLEILNLGGDIKIIGGYAFANTNVQMMILPHTLTQIQRYAFYNSDVDSITIPSNVTFIGRNAFYNAKDLIGVAFDSNSKLATIEREAFARTTELETITLPKSLTSLGSSAFEQSGLEQVLFEEGMNLKEISEKAFLGTNITSVSIPASVVIINHNAFRDCLNLSSVVFNNTNDLTIMNDVFYNTGLTEVNINENITYIGEYSFNGLRELTEFNVSEDNEHYQSINGVLFSKNGKKLISFPGNITGSYTIPNYVETIGFGAFENSKLEEVNFENNINLLTIGYRAFYNSSIKQISIPSSVISIDYYAFAMCDNLTKVEFADDNNLLGIYEGAFYLDRNLSEITIPDSIIEISDFAFYGCESLNRLPINSTSQLLGIYDYTFAYSGIENLDNIPSTINTYGDYCFAGIKAKEITISFANDDLVLGFGMFSDCNCLEEITLPFIGRTFDDEEYTWIGYIFGAGNYMANDSYVPSTLNIVNISENIARIGTGAFYHCSNLSTINLPEWVELIGISAFDGTPANSYSINVTLNQYAIENGQYSWLSGLNKVIVEEGVTELPNLCFQNSSLNSIELPNTLEKLGESCFDACNNLKTIQLPKKISEIPYKCFINSGLIGIDLSNTNVETIDDFAFQYCNIRSITFNDSIKSLGTYAFSYCHNLTKINIPNSLTFIPAYCFEKAGLTEITLPSNLTNIEDNAFIGCDYLYYIYNNSDIELELGETNNGYISLYAHNIYDKNGGLIHIDNSLVYYDTIDGLRFTVINNKYTLIAYLGDETDIVLPLTINEKKYDIKKARGFINVIFENGFEEIPSEAFYNDTFLNKGTLKSIILPDTVKVIGARAFCNNRNLINIILGNNVEIIETDAFTYTGITEINLPSSLKKLDGLWGTKIEKLVLPEDLEYIGAQAFDYCTSLEYLYVGSKIEQIQFHNCPVLKTIEISEANPFIKTRDGIIYNAEMTKITSCYNCPEILVIPGTVEEISTFAFANMDNLKKVVINEGVKAIGTWAFLRSVNLKEIQLPNTLETIGFGAFEGCESLIELNIPSGVNYIANNIIMDSGVKILNVDSNNEYYYSYENNLIEKNTKTLISGTSPYIPEGVEIIGEHAYRHNKFAEIILPSTVTTIRRDAFDAVFVEYIELPSNLTNLEVSSQASGTLGFVKYLKNNSDISITFDDSSRYFNIMCIGDENAYYIKTIVDKDGNIITKDEDYLLIETADHFKVRKEDGIYYLYGYCGEEDTVTLPTQIMGSDYVLYGCDGIKNLIINSNFNNENFIQLQPGFINTETLKSLYVTVTSPIYVGGFTGFKNLNTVVIDGPCYLYGFNGCINLTNISLSQNISAISSDTFSGTGLFLDESNWKNGMLIIDNYLVAVDKNIKELTVPNTVITMAIGILDDCYNLKKIDLGNCEYQSNNDYRLGDVSNLDTLVISNDKIDTVTSYFGSIYNYKIPLTLKNIVINNNINKVDSNYLYGISNVNIFVDNYKASLEWNKKYPNWNNGNKVYYKGEWIQIEFFDQDDSLVNMEYYGIHQVIRQPYMKDIDNGETTYRFVGWDITNDGIVDSIPATSTSNIVAKAMYQLVATTYKVKYYGLNNELLEIQEYDYNEIIVLPNDPIRKGYTFSGWNNYTDGKKALGNYNFYANFVHDESGHNYIHTHVDATCEHEGYDLYKCSICDDEYKENIIDALSHEYGEWIIDTESNCTEEGLRHRVCSNCGHIEEEIIDALGHSYESKISKEATCSHTGEINHKCTICGDEFTEVIPMTEHHYEKKVVRRYLIDIIISQLLNLFFGYEGNNGYYYKCSECGHIATSDENVSIASVTNAGHDHNLGDWEIISEANCVDEGILGRKCQECHEWIEIKEIPNVPNNHNYGEWETTKAATCTEKGNEHRICSECSHEDIRDIEALGHNFSEEWTIDVEATCEHEGSKSHHCSRCEEKTDITVIEKLNHNPAEAVREKEKAATCTEDGSYDEVIYCKDCHTEISRTPKTIEAEGHKYGEWETTKAATCTEKGSEHRICSECSHEDIRDIEALGHNFSEEWTIDVEATCEHEGSKSHHCSRCEEKTDISVIEKLDPSVEFKKIIESMNKTDSAEVLQSKIAKANQVYSLIDNKESVKNEYNTLGEYQEYYSSITDNKSNSNNGLSGGVIAGIIAGSVAVIAAIAVGVFFILKKKKSV